MRSSSTGVELARATVVAPVSTEMRCDACHYDGALEDIATGRVETNILTLHDRADAGGERIGKWFSATVLVTAQR